MLHFVLPNYCVLQLHEVSEEVTEQQKNMQTAITAAVEDHSSKLRLELDRAGGGANTSDIIKSRLWALDGMPFCTMRNIHGEDTRSDRCKLPICVNASSNTLLCFYRDKLHIMPVSSSKAMSIFDVATMAWPAFCMYDGHMPHGPDLVVQADKQRNLPPGEWVCLGLTLALASGVNDSNREHYFTLKLVQVEKGEFAVAYIDGCVLLSVECRLLAADC